MKVGADLLKKVTDLAENGPPISSAFFVYTPFKLCCTFLLCLGKVGKMEMNMFRTMLVDDSSSFRQLFKENMQDQFPSMDVIEAADGVEALQKIEFYPLNLIFIDMRLPGENGLELTRKIKADYPDVMIIILTSHDLPEYREAAIRHKANYFLSKGSIITDDIFILVKSILLEKGFNADGSNGQQGHS